MTEINTNTETFNCSNCEKDYSNENKIETDIDGMYTVCEDCFAEYTFNCSDCNDDFHVDSMNGHNEESYCEDCYEENVGFCNDCGESEWRDQLHYSDRYEELYCENCYPGEGDDVDLESYNVKEMVNGLTREGQSDRYIGLEIECVTTLYDFWDLWDVGEITSSRRFRPVSDSSIRVNNSEDEKGVEWVMRNPMQGDTMRQAVDHMLEALNNGDYYVNKSCGLHVHIDARDMDYQDLKWTLLLGKSSQDVIYKMMPPSRVSTRWSRRIPLDRKSILSIDSNEEFVDSWYDAWGVPPSYDKYNDSRYCGMNMHSRITNGSIEFRYHSGTLNSEKIHNWITICQKIVDAGKLLSTYCNIDNIDNITPKHRYIKTLQSIIEERNLTFGNFCRYLRLGVETTNYVRSRLTKFYNTNQKDDYRAMEFYI